jgi:hypothetical protein
MKSFIIAAKSVSAMLACDTKLLWSLGLGSVDTVLDAAGEPLFQPMVKIEAGPGIHDEFGVYVLTKYDQYSPICDVRVGEVLVYYRHSSGFLN